MSKKIPIWAIHFSRHSTIQRDLTPRVVYSSNRTELQGKQPNVYANQGKSRRLQSEANGLKQFYVFRI